IKSMLKLIDDKAISKSGSITDEKEKDAIVDMYRTSGE
ncbi:hypothetical protein CISIN_1g0353142mg, partial [Citrus sinensis]